MIFGLLFWDCGPRLPKLPRKQETIAKKVPLSTTVGKSGMQGKNVSILQEYIFQVAIVAKS